MDNKKTLLFNNRKLLPFSIPEYFLRLKCGKKPIKRLIWALA
jgi:hypothetical protein